MTSRLGRTLLLANPAAQSGKGAQGAAFVERTLQVFEGATDGFECRLTEASGDASRLARAAEGFDTLLVLGGDGTIHEAVNGLMAIEACRRPRLGVIPLGSGNDFARTLGLALNSPENSLGQLLQGERRRIDLGLVGDVYFDQTLSFGVDAAIALDTMERRQRNAAHGTRLFAGSGIDVIRHQMRSWPYQACADGTAWQGSSIIFAVQLGPTYGGGFRICPAADASDGLFDLCYSEGSPSVATALSVLLRARLALHTHSHYLRFVQASHLTLEFWGEPPCQADGECLEGSHFDIRCVPSALEVIVPRSRS